VRRYLILLLAAMHPAAPSFPQVTSSYDHFRLFDKYHTYSWRGVDARDALSSDRLKAAIDGQLTAKGWRRVDSGGDTWVVAFGSTHTNREVLGAPTDIEAANGQIIKFAPPVGYASFGTLQIHILDAQSKDAIWRGLCTEKLTKNPQKNEKKFEKDVAKVFRKFPAR
jgi:hypothetical protein